MSASFGNPNIGPHDHPTNSYKSPYGSMYASYNPYGAIGTSQNANSKIPPAAADPYGYGRHQPQSLPPTSIAGQQLNYPIGSQRYATGRSHQAYEGLSPEAQAQVHMCNGPVITPDCEDELRVTFFRKTMSLFGLQLALTTCVILVAALVPTVNRGLRATPQIGMFCSIAALALLCAMVCSQRAMRKHPLNLCLTTAFTCLYSVAVATICIQYQLASVAACFGGACIMSLGLAVLALKMKTDLTSKGMYLLGLSLGLLGFGLIMILLGGFKSSGLSILYHSAGLLLACVFILFRIQLIAGGKHRKYAFGLDDAMLAATCLYLDVMEVFLRLLRLFGNRNE